VGKPLKQARADAVALARYCEFYGGAADKVMGETIPYLAGYTVYTLREPHGVTGISCRGTTRCRSSGGRWARRSPWGTPAW
jgi:acyl-CoA reductase-like NAD-dependent aldehyde dehydrogenase